MRADARRNRERLLDAARDVFVERGPDASLEEIARRSDVGIATLYRHFVDRNTLMHTVVLHALTSTAEAAERARREHADPLEALAAYIHAVIDLRTSAVIPALLGAIDLDEPQIRQARTTSARLVEELLETAQRSGRLRADTAFADIGLVLVRCSQKLPGPFTEDAQQVLAHRHADLLIAGLTAGPAQRPLSGPAMDLAELRKMLPQNVDAS
ncbi:TetR/AcrR family transcriptional regulator [Catenulispora sp. NF23]|uniref:TetR/AcrR family transcriptional regulator n=1 Tax=Catenulispora pinistramenti TaxID=2705254 RepID=A0ABS5L5E8_9ACTN|nr:TetR/AcrR family transcriptional regulator [Catenulispora pinistramenti]MBS2537435.1 TetR/AcrR family transcriptional regulator [Catenulispora pinistramenti]MBS2553335.1 TetR/AcrR family transcriptional regulator [Catenulispora pinistramenti]